MTPDEGSFWDLVAAARALFEGALTDPEYFIAREAVVDLMKKKFPRDYHYYFEECAVFPPWICPMVSYRTRAEMGEFEPKLGLWARLWRAVRR